MLSASESLGELEDMNDNALQSQEHRPDTIPPPDRFSLRSLFVVLTATCIWSAIVATTPVIATIIFGVAGSAFYIRGVAREHAGFITLGAILILLSCCALVLPSFLRLFVE
jgi:hypothetical protein